MSFRPVLLVPHYNHAALFGALLPKLAAAGLPMVVVDDGSSDEQRRAVQALAAAHAFRLVAHERNQGKGAAVMTGLRAASDAGFSHALQVDADGQHDTADIGRLLAAAEAHPESLVCGQPVFGDDIPASRRWGRKLTNVLVALETWLRQVPDAMCGFRVYPLASVVTLIAATSPGQRMDFDVEVLVRACWRGIPLRVVPTRVRYPAGGVSHFNYLRDNAIISAMHARLMVGMLLRSPALLYRRLRGRRAGRPAVDG